MTKDIGKKLKLERINQDLTIEDAAYDCGLSTVTVYKIEKGDEVKLKSFRQYAEHLGFHVEIHINKY